MQPTICDTCKGTGLVGLRTCQTCHGYAVAISADGLGLYWGTRVDSFAILERRAERAVRGAVNFALLLAGIAGFFLLLWEAAIQGFDAVFSAAFWTRGTIRIFLFWVSVWLDFYLGYRLVRESERVEQVRRRRYAAGADVQTRAISWEELWKMPAKQRADISRAFSSTALKSVEEAYEFASRSGAAQVTNLHLFVALLGQPTVGFLIFRLGIDRDKLRDTIGRALEREALKTGELLLAPESFAALFEAYLGAYRTRARAVAPIELFAAVVRGSEKVQAILDEVGAAPSKVENVIAWVRIVEELRERWRAGRARARLRPKGPVGRAMTAVATPYLDQFSDDLTELARRGYVTPCVDREKEMEQIFRILEGGRASVALVGPHGVGKTVILDGIAERMVEEDVPEILRDKRLVVLSVEKLISGATPSEAAERLETIFADIFRGGNVVLAVPRIHGLVGIALGGGRAIDLAQILAAGIERGISVIATTDPEGYREVERSPLGPALERVEISEPEINLAIQILEGKTGAIEAKHRVIFSYDAIEKAVTLSDRYLQDRHLPEKAIEILREVALAVRNKRGERAVVTGEDAAAIVAEKSKVPVTAVTEEETAKLLRLEEELHRRVVGQDEAVRAVSAAIRRARAELRAANRPIANFLFLGPTGVGKTELAKTVAAVYFGSEERMVRLDMSEYQDTASIYRLIGSPGGPPGGILTEAIRKQPFALLLLDEIEKAHPDILNVFLQVMDDGRITDNVGRVIDFTNVILIGTSNAGSQAIQDGLRAARSLEAIKQQLLEVELKSYFRPEFLNRFDGIIVFKPLTQEEIVEVARLMLIGVAKQLEGKGITLQVAEEAVRELAAAGFDPVFGARPLRRVIQERVQDALANFLLQQKIGRRDIVIFDKGGQIRIEKREI